MELLRPLADGKRVRGIAGSAYHDSLDTSLDLAICQRLGGVVCGGFKTFHLGGPERTLNVCHGGASPTIYRATHDDRESLFMDAARGSGAIRHSMDVAVRGHWHTYVYQDVGHRVLCRVPGWQAWYDAKFMRGVIGRKNSFMGGVVLGVRPKRVVPHSFLYPPLPIGGEVEAI